MVTLCESANIKQCRVCEEWLDAEDVREDGRCDGCSSIGIYDGDDRPDRVEAMLLVRSIPEKFTEAERKYNEAAWRIYHESQGRWGWSDHEWRGITKPENRSDLMWQA